MTDVTREPDIVTTGMGSDLATPRPLNDDEEQKFRESVAAIVRIKGDDDYSLQWSNYAAARLLATINRLRAIEAAARAFSSSLSPADHAALRADILEDVCADCRNGYHGRCTSFDCACTEWSALQEQVPNG